MKHLKYISGIAIIVICVVLLGLHGFRKSRLNYITVSEALQQDSTQERPVLVTGKVIPGSVSFSSDGSILNFTIADGENTLPVRYHGEKPDFLINGGEVVIEGSLGADGVFGATKLLRRK